MTQTYLHKRPALDPCPIEWVVAMVGGKWKARILYLLSLDRLPFSALRRELGDISQQVLSTQLRAMEKHGLVERLRPTDGERSAGCYSLTPRGRELTRLLMPLADWGTQQIRLQGLEWTAPTLAA